MCIIIAKYFGKHQGWIGIKNRDRNYIPSISFERTHVNGMEIMLFMDDITKYCEGFNSNGIAILSASLMVRDDEKERDNRSSDSPSKDGIKIREALQYNTIEEVVKNVVDLKLTGHTIIFSKDKCFTLEGAWRKGEYLSGGFEYVLKELSHDDIYTRTNHGIDIPWAGYQNDGSKSHEVSRKSSESRLQIAEYVANEGMSMEEILDGLAKNYINDGQMNALRTTNKYKKMRTTSQIAIMPSQMTMFVRPVQSHLTYNFWELNSSTHLTWVELLSNRVLHTDGNYNSDIAFFKKLRHKSK